MEGARPGRGQIVGVVGGLNTTRAVVLLLAALRARYRSRTGRALHSLAHEAQDPVLLAEAHRALELTVLRLDQISLARTHAEQALTLSRPDMHSNGHLLRYACNPAIHSPCCLAGFGIVKEKNDATWQMLIKIHSSFR